MKTVILEITASDFSSGQLLFFALLAGVAIGVGLYFAVHTYYRNSNRTHDFEDETTVQVYNMKRQDQRVDTRRGTRSSSIDGENTNNHRLRVFPLRD